MITVMIAECTENMEGLAIWKQVFTSLANQHKRDIRLKFVKDIIEVGFYLNTVDIVFISADFKEYKNDLQAMAGNKSVICLEGKLDPPSQILKYIEQVIPD